MGQVTNYGPPPPLRKGQRRSRAAVETFPADAGEGTPAGEPLPEVAEPGTEPLELAEPPRKRTRKGGGSS